MGQLKCKVVMLPHNQKAVIGFNRGINRYYTVRQVQMASPIIHQWNHLYLTSNREIQVGDYVMVKTVNSQGISLVRKAFKVDEVNNSTNRVYLLATGMMCPLENAEKIEATTETTLKLSLIGQPFVEAYIEAQGNIEEVLLETQMGEGKSVAGVEYWGPTDTLSIKTREDGTVIIHKLKNNWNREEIKPLLDAVKEYADVMVGDKTTPIHLHDMVSERTRLLNLINNY